MRGLESLTSFLSINISLKRAVCTDASLPNYGVPPRLRTSSASVWRIVRARRPTQELLEHLAKKDPPCKPKTKELGSHGRKMIQVERTARIPDL